MGTAFRHLSPSFAMSAELTTFLFSFQGFLSLIVLLLTLYVSSCFLFRDVCVSDPEKKAVLITGCDSGFGYELAKKLDARGLRVFASCLTSEGQAMLRGECSPQLSTLKLDVTEPSDVQNAVEFVKSRLPPQGLWAVVNNAGICDLGLIEWATVEEMKQVVEVNFWGTVLVTKAFLPLLKRTKGRIVNVASSWGRVCVPGVMAYCVSKYAVQAFCDSLRREVKPFGVTVHIIEPGMFKTNITDRKRNVQHLERLWDNLDGETKESYGAEFYEQVKSACGNKYKFLLSPHIYKVVDAMFHAVTSTRPKLRYMVGWDHNLFWRPLSLLPSEIQDLVLRLPAKPKGIPDHN